MTTLRSSLLALALSAGVAAATIPAAAEGLPDRDGRPQVLPSWSGIYGGVHLGNAEVRFDDGLIGGVQFGRNWQNGGIVYGLEGDVSLTEMDEVDWMATVRGRLGYLIHPSILVYGTAGVGFVDARDDTETDFVYGVGVEGKLTQAATVRLEYLGFGGDTDVDVVRVGLNFKLGAWGWGY